MSGQAITSGQGAITQGNAQIRLQSRKVGGGTGTQALSGLFTTSAAGLFTPIPSVALGGQSSSVAAGSVAKQRTAALLGGSIGVLPGSFNSATVSNYRSAQTYLFETIDTPSRPSTLGGSVYSPDIWGPTYGYIDRQAGWAWTNLGGDWLDSSLTSQGNSPWASVAINSVGTFTVDITSLLQRCQTVGKWVALLLRGRNDANTADGGARTIAGPYSTGHAAPSISVLYAGSSSGVTLNCRIVAVNSVSSSGPATAQSAYSLPVFVEFERPTRAVTSATISFEVLQTFSGNCNLQVMHLNPAINSQPVTGTTGLASQAGALDSGLSSVSGILGVHRYLDGTALTDFVVDQTSLSKSAEVNYNPVIWGGAADTTKWPNSVSGKWVKNSSMAGLTSPTLVSSSYGGEGFSPLASGLGALKITMPNEVTGTGMEGGNSGTLASDLLLFMDEPIFGLLNHIFVRYYVRQGDPSLRTPADRVEVLQSGVPTWTQMTGKTGIGPSHATTYGGVSGSSGGGYGWQMRNGWYECDTNQGGPDESGQAVGFHIVDDYQSNNPVGFRYGTPGDTGQLDNPQERWGQIGGLGGMRYADRWYCVETEMKLNSVTLPSTWSADGELRCWVDGRMVFEKTGMVFRTVPLQSFSADPSKIRPARELGVKELWLNWFHGGQTKSSVARTHFYTGLAWGTSRIGPMFIPPAWANSLSTGQWAQQSSTLQSVEPTPTPSGTNPNAKVFAWTGFSINTQNSRVYATACGGHTDYAGNEVDMLDLEAATPAWVQLRGPTPNASLLNADYYADADGHSRPASRHNYYSAQFDETANRPLLFGGSRWQSGAVDNKVDGYDIASGDYLAAGTYPDMPASLNNQEVKAFGRDSRTGDIYVFANFNVAKWTRATNTWSSPISNQSCPFNSNANGTACAFDSSRHQFFLAGGGSCWTYDPDANTTAVRTLTGTDFSGDTAGCAIVYEPVLDAFLVRQNASGGTILRVDPTTFAVTSFTTFGGSSIPSIGASQGKGPLTKFLYVPRLHGCVYVPDYTTGFWFLKTH